MVYDVTKSNFHPAERDEVCYMARYDYENHLCFGNHRRVSSVKQQTTTTKNISSSTEKIF